MYTIYIREYTCMFLSFWTFCYPSNGRVQIFVTQICIHSYKLRNCTRKNCRLGSCIWTPTCWTEVSMHTEGPVTGQLHQTLPSLSSVLQQTFSWYQKSTFLSMLNHAALPKINFKILVQMQPPPHVKNISSYCFPPNTKFSPNSHLLSLLHTPNSPFSISLPTSLFQGSTLLLA